MAIARMTSADVIALNSSEEVVGLINELLDEGLYPEVKVIPATPITKITYKTLVLTALPSVGFRAANVGREHQKATLVARQVDCEFLDASWGIDERVARASEWGVDAACGVQAKAHLSAAMKALSDQVWYGVSADAGGFAGIASLHPNNDSSRTVDAAGTTQTTASSVFAIKRGVQAVCFAWGEDGKIAEGPREYTQIFDGDGKVMWGWAQAISGWAGLQITNQQATGRICNLTEDSGKGLTDLLLADLWSQFKVGKKPDVLFMSRRSNRQLRDSRTATNPTGAPAPFPKDWEGIPIEITDSVVDVETLLVAAS